MVRKTLASKLGAAQRSYLVLLLPFLFFWTMFVFFPLLMCVIWSFWKETEIWMIPAFTTADSYEKIFFSSERINIFLRSVRIAAVVTVIDMIIAIPLGYYLAKMANNKRWVMTFLMLMAIPFFMNYEARAYVWRLILQKSGLVNTVLLNLGLIREPILTLVFNEFAVYLGLVISYLPFMLFPIWLAISIIDDSLLEASSILGASFMQTFRYIILPLAAPGIFAGWLFVFVPNLGASSIPTILGGGAVPTLGTIIPSSLFVMKYPLVAAMCTILFAIMVVMLLISNKVFHLGILLEKITR